MVTPRSGADAPNSEKSGNSKIVLFSWVRYSAHTGIYPTSLFGVFLSEIAKTPIVP